jgi:hypothetical protein
MVKKKGKRVGAEKFGVNQHDRAVPFADGAGRGEHQ